MTKILDLYISWVEYGISLGYTELEVMRLLEDQQLNPRTTPLSLEERWPRSIFPTGSLRYDDPKINY